MKEPQPRDSMRHVLSYARADRPMSLFYRSVIVIAVIIVGLMLILHILGLAVASITNIGFGHSLKATRSETLACHTFFQKIAILCQIAYPSLIQLFVPLIDVYCLVALIRLAKSADRAHMASTVFPVLAGIAILGLDLCSYAVTASAPIVLRDAANNVVGNIITQWEPYLIIEYVLQYCSVIVVIIVATTYRILQKHNGAV